MAASPSLRGPSVWGRNLWAGAFGALGTSGARLARRMKWTLNIPEAVIVLVALMVDRN